MLPTTCSPIRCAHHRGTVADAMSTATTRTTRSPTPQTMRRPQSGRPPTFRGASSSLTAATEPLLEDERDPQRDAIGDDPAVLHVDLLLGHPCTPDVPERL